MMDNDALLRRLVAPLAGIEETELRPSTQLGGRLKTSIGRATLDALLRREFGTRGPAAYQAATFGELESAVLGRTSGSPAPTDFSAPPRSSDEGRHPFSCGIDVELIENLPTAADYWVADFYRTHFTSNEIAYCVRQESPREHFAVRWCAKEALKKCDSRFLSVAFNQLEVVAEESGRVHLATAESPSIRPLPHALSVSHTSVLAVAVVIAVPPEELRPASTRPPSETRVRPPAPVVACAAFGLSLAAFLLTLWHLFLR